MTRKNRKFIELISLAFLLFGLEYPSVIVAQESEQLRGYYQEIINDFESNLAIARESGDRLEELRVWTGVGQAYQYMGEYQKAVAVYQKAWAIATEIKEYGMVENVLTMLGNAYSKLGDYQGIDFYEEKLQLARTRADRQIERIILGKLALAYLANTEYPKAIAAYEQYLPFVQELNDPLQEILTLSQLASAYGAARQKTKLKATLDRMLAVAEASGDPQLENTALQMQSSWSHVIDEGDQAIVSQIRALQLARQRGDLQGELHSLQQLALLHAPLGDTEKMISLLEESLAIAKNSDNQFLSQFWQAQSLDYLSITYAHLENYQKAIDLQRQSLGLYREMNQESARDADLSQAWALGHLGSIQFRAGKFTAARDDFESALEIHARLRTEVLGNTNLFAMSRDDLNINIREWASDIYRTQQEILVAQNRTDEALAIAEAGRARAFVDLLTLNLGADPQSQSPAVVPTIDQLRDIAKAQNSTFVQYSVIYDRPWQSLLKFSKSPPQAIGLYIWVIQPDGKITFRRSNLSQLDNTLTKVIFRARCFKRRSCRHKQQLQQLHQVLIAPIADLLPPNPEARVTFIPQDGLFLVPFPALVDANDKYLIEKHTILTAPAIQVLDLTRQQRQRLPRSSSGRNLVVGNPIMPSLRTRPDRPMEQLSSLPGAEAEAKAIASLLGSKPLIGGQATELAVVQQMLDARHIHLATHGLLDKIGGFQSALAFTPAGKEDGFLTAREIINLKLTAELVVLSACDTGRGRISGDGVIGLSRSFIAAGVPSLVVSLWKVPDGPTKFFMVSFYQHLQRTTDKAQALRQAMLATIQQFPNPEDWAAFTLIGEAD